MTIRFGSLLLLLCVSLSAIESDSVVSGQEKDRKKGKNSIAALFDGIPADLRLKVRDNPVRCDRANDWLKEHVNAKGKFVEVRLQVDRIELYRREANYLVHLLVDRASVKVLGDEWLASLEDVTSGGARSRRNPINFSFVDVSPADAEKLADAKHVVIQGRVRDVTLQHSSSVPVAGPLTIAIVLDDIQVDGKKWTPYVPAFGPGVGPPGAGGKKKGGFGDPGGKAKKVGGAAQKNPMQ